MTKPKREWCNKEYTHIDCGSKIKQSNRIRCKICNRLLKTIVKGCGDYKCWHVYIPPHKGKYK